MRRTRSLFAFCLLLLQLAAISSGFQSDELLFDDEEFGLEGGIIRSSSDVAPQIADSPSRPAQTAPKSRASVSSSSSDSDSKVQFSLEHAFGDADFSPAGTFTARLKTSSHGGTQSLTKLRFSRNAFTEAEKLNFKKLLEDDDFYKIRLPSNVLNPPGRDYVVSSVKARCLSRGGLDELFVIHVEGGNVVGVNYGSPGACQHPRQLKLPTKWSFNSHTFLKTSEQAPRTPVFSEAIVSEIGEGEEVKPPERSFWAKYWMYLIPLGIIVMNAMTQAMNMAEEQPGRQPGTATQAAGVAHGQNTAAVRRR